jgi:hypothetical protein
MAVFVDPFLLTLTLVLTILMIIGNLYFLAHYSHYADSGFGSSAACKFIIMVAFMLAECQLLLLPLDLINTRENTNVDMFVFWQVIYMSSLFMMVVFLPFAYFFYETEEDNDYKTRFCTAFKNWLGLFIIFSLIHFPMFASMRHSYVPLESYAYKGLEGTPDQAKIDSVFLTIEDDRILLPIDKNEYEFLDSLTLHTQLTFAAYTIGALSFWGSFMLVFFMGTGLVAIPFENIITWLDRPVPMNESEFKKKKDVLTK